MTVIQCIVYISTIYIEVISAGTGCACTCMCMITEVRIVLRTENGICPVVNLRISTEAAAELPRIIIFQCLTLFHVTNTSVTRQLYIAYAIFQIGDANTQIIEFIGKFIS